MKKSPDRSGLFSLPLAGLEPARCYPLDFESSASANSATAARRYLNIIASNDVLVKTFLNFSLTLIFHILQYIAKIKCRKIILRRLCTADHLCASVFLEQNLC